MLHIRTPWTRQPQGNTRVASAAVSNLALRYVVSGHGAVAAFNTNGLTVPTIAGTITRGVGPGGLMFETAAGALNGLSIGDPDILLDNGSEFTFAIVRRCKDTTPRASSLFGYASGGDSLRVQAHAPFSDGNLYWDYGNDGSGRLSFAYTKDTQLETLVFVASASRGREVWRRGVKVGSNANNITRASTPVTAFGIGSNGLTNSDSVEIYLAVLAQKAWAPFDIVSWCNNPWQLFAPIERRIWVPSAGGGFSSTGALAATAATVAGAASHLTLHSATGSLVSASATLSGVATSPHLSTGALVVGAATIAGTANRLTAHTSTGALAAGSAVLSGAANVGTGFNAAGSLSAQAAAVVGAATRFAFHTSSGTLTSAAASLSGAATHTSAAGIYTYMWLRTA